MRFYAAGHALITRHGKYLVTRRSPDAHYMPLKWDIPGGIVLPAETLEEAIHREVKEETQLTIRIGPVIHVYSNRDQVPKRQTFQIVYLAEYISGKVILNPTEHTLYRWLRYEEISNLNSIAFLQDLVRSYKPSGIL